ncbi:RICIN domain-containing protein [Streptomyces sp. NPDC090445]|uniref:RICIN domain-containing protein n=1 Tax=Streptomyces sp. NPDC090445 TaxID=3365963 RepID=UPI003819E10E
MPMTRPRVLTALLSAAALAFLAASPSQSAPVEVVYRQHIWNAKTGKCLDIPGVDPPTQGSALTQYTCLPGPGDNQEFDLVQVAGAKFVIRSSRNPSLCLDLPGTEAPGNSKIGFYPCQYTTADNQVWSKVGRSGDSNFMIINDKAWNNNRLMCLDVAGLGSPANDLPVGLYGCAPFDTRDDHWWNTW